MMTADNDLNSGNENNGIVVEKIINVNQRDELVAMQEYVKGRTKKTTEKEKLTTMLESVEEGITVEETGENCIE